MQHRIHHVIIYVSSSTMSGISFAVVSLFILFFSNTVVASPCIAFDASFNLLAFGLGGKDWSAGTQDTWKNSLLPSPLSIFRQLIKVISRRTCFGNNCFRTPVSLFIPSLDHLPILAAGHSMDLTPLVTFHK
jgi:hypothetical protein